MTEDDEGPGTDFVVRYGRAMRRIDVTPELAREWLATLPGAHWPGGKVDAAKVARYAAMMRAGTWQLIPMPVVIRRGRLLSSRHRLTAVIEADMTVPMYVSDDSCPR